MDPYIRTASEVTRQLFEILDEKGIRLANLAVDADVHHNSLCNWRAGRNSPTIIDLEGVLAVLGLKLAILPIEPETEPQKQKAA